MSQQSPNRIRSTPTRVRYPSNSNINQQKNERVKTEQAIKELKIQLEQEEEMSPENLEEFEKEYFSNRLDINIKLKYALQLIRSKKYKHKQEGLDLLYSMYRAGIGQAEDEADNEIVIEPVIFRTVLYYLAVANYRLGYFQESKRFVDLILSKEPEQQQALNFSKLLTTYSSKKILVVIDRGVNTGLAFNKALQIYREGDEIILVTVIEDTEVYDFMKASGLHNSPAYDTLCDSHTKEVCAPLQEKFQFICEDREIYYNYLYEAGNPKTDICSIIDQEGISICVVADSTHPEKKGIISRMFGESLSEYLYHHAHCDVIIVHPKSAQSFE